jgi:hypothetical protein
MEKFEQWIDMSAISSTIDRITSTLRWTIVAVVICYLIMLLQPVFSQWHPQQNQLKEVDTELCLLLWATPPTV